MPNSPVPVTEFSQDYPEFMVCMINTSVAELAKMHSIPFKQWENSDLGPGAGLICKTDTGLVLFINEYDYMREDKGAEGPIISVDGGELIRRGLDTTIADILGGLGLTRENLVSGISDSEFEDVKESLRNWKRPSDRPISQ